MKILGLVLSVIIIGAAIPVFGAYFENISSKSLIQNQTGASGRLVRVGIGSQNFSSYAWNSASLYGTGEFEVYNNDTYIDTFDKNKTINISMVSKIFVLTDSENNVIAKVSGPLIFRSDYGLLGVKNLKRAGKDALYRGQLELICPKEGQFHIVNNIELQDYLKGVVPNEMPVHFGLEALKAQAVAARNYVLSPRVKANPNYDVVDSVASQVYFGANTEKSESNQAVEETNGIVALYDWEMILALYSSTAGGYTESYSNAFSDPKTKAFPSGIKPYLRAKPDYEKFGILNNEEAAEEFYTNKPDAFDIKSPYYRWEREWTLEELQNEVQNHIAAQSAAGFVHPAVNKGEVIGKITGLNVLARGFSGKIMKLEIKTDTINYIVEKELVIRRLFTVKGKALPSANFVIKQETDDEGNLINIKIYGGGFGHGVGLSQYGAGFMGTHLHKSFDEILRHYYTDVVLGTEPFTISSANSSKVQSFYSKNGTGTLVVDNRNRLEYTDLMINGVFESVKLNKNERFTRIDLTKYLQRGLNSITFIYPKYADINSKLKMYVELVGKNEH